MKLRGQKEEATAKKAEDLAESCLVRWWEVLEIAVGSCLAFAVGSWQFEIASVGIPLTSTA